MALDPTEAVHELPEFKSLLDLLSEQRPGLDLTPVREAYRFAYRAHQKQLRMSGEPYVLHPVAVARIVADLHMDVESVVAALLHDVLEDTEITQQLVEARFGRVVLDMVEGVTKLRLNIRPEASARQKAVAETNRAAESLRKMLLAMAQDVRVMVIKLADRLHNMRTIDSLPEQRQTRIATETMDIYAPLAARLGIWQIKWQLEDLAFKVLHPSEFHQISDLVVKKRNQREEELQEAVQALRARLDDRGLEHVLIQGRPKHLYSIFSKIVQQDIPFDSIYDLIGLRLVARESSECYLALGIVHDLWLPMPGLFYDYIAMPKPNGYKSLHTKVIGPKGDPMEVQIRTQEMHAIAEFGVAAHWAYKELPTQRHAGMEIGKLRQQLFDWSSDHRTSSDFLRTVSSDLFSEQVFCFTPKGDVLDLPMGASPIDFAFRVHSELGLLVVGAKVNGVMVPLSTKLQNGDVVELITRSNAQPSLDWLEFAKSQHARSKLRAYFRKRHRTENAQRGKEALEKELKSRGIDPKQVLGEERLNELAKLFRNCENGQDLLAKVGEGQIGAARVVSKLKPPEQPGTSQDPFRPRARAHTTTISSGVDNVMVKRARCCTPIPEDDVVGYVTRGRGIMIHRRVCPNALRLADEEPERLMGIEWPSNGQEYPVSLSIVTVNRQGLLMDISTIFSDAKTNISSARIRTLPNQTAEIDVVLDVRDLTQLEAILTKVGNLSDVISTLRVFGRTAIK